MARLHHVIRVSFRYGHFLVACPRFIRERASRPLGHSIISSRHETNETRDIELCVHTLQQLSARRSTFGTFVSRYEVYHVAITKFVTRVAKERKMGLLKIDEARYATLEYIKKYLYKIAIRDVKIKRIEKLYDTIEYTRFYLFILRKIT